MAITINIYYTGEKGNAKRFAKEMISSGIVDAIRKEEGNLRYEYFIPMDDEANHCVARKIRFAYAGGTLCFRGTPGC